MPKADNPKEPKTETKKPSPLKLKQTEKLDSNIHVFANKVVCDTERRGHTRPKGRSPLEIVVDASEGFIPLWVKNTTLRWTFKEESLRSFEKPTSVKNEMRKLLGEALLEWGEAVPVTFAERDDAWDFEIVMRRRDDCDINGCVLASAFFPDAGRHELVVYPMMFEQTRKEQVETMAHELGHVFGLRHFFASISETAWPSEIFGTHERFSIMNYGADSQLTAEDKADLKSLYAAAWSGDLTQINGTPIRFVKPFHLSGAPSEQVMRARAIKNLLQPEMTPAYRQ
jgi:hypothetical protein